MTGVWRGDGKDGQNDGGTEACGKAMEELDDGDVLEEDRSVAERRFPVCNDHRLRRPANTLRPARTLSLADVSG